MKLKEMKALIATLNELALQHPEGVLMAGENELTNEFFCYPINVNKAKDKLIKCNKIDIRGIGFYCKIEKAVVDWLQNHIRLPPSRKWLNMASPHNWLKYNIDADMFIMHLSIAHKHYYICLRDKYVYYYRQKLLALPHLG